MGVGRVVSRFGLLLAVLLLLLGGTSAVASPRVPVTGASVSSAPSTHDDNARDQPRQSATARHVPPTAASASDGWWVVCQPASGGPVPHGRSPVRAAAGAELVTAVSAPWSSRAPPRA